jgi:ribose-phosphate pyrophosphokinase
MLELNLVYKEESDIKYKISNFPDGQQDVTITTNNDTSFFRQVNEVIIKSSFNNFKDLELIICATKALRNLKVERIHLYIPYILGARSDRKFVEGGTSYLKDVVAPILNAQNYITVTCIDAHSDVAAACINNLEVTDNSWFVRVALTKQNQISLKNAVDSFTLISPDAGALKKIYNLAEKLEYKKDILIASKHRDITTGKILSTNVPLNAGEHTNNNFLIVDDICDGGRTFIEIAKAIHEIRPDAKVSLAITHGIFSGGYYELSKHIDHIYCTNSVKDIEIESDSDYTVSKDYITQINVY